MRFDQQLLLRVWPDAKIWGTTFPVAPVISIDSRHLQAGEIFIALAGEQTDGHKFLDVALQKGAAGLVIAQSHQNLLPNLVLNYQHCFVAVVSDPLIALVQLATFWRSQFSYPVVAVTGSVGKTSTKEILVAILQQAQKSCCWSQGNLNTLVGLSISVLAMRSEHEIAIFELGITHVGEMERLVAIAKPTIALITSVGHAHMGGLGSISEIAAEKRKIFKFFAAKNIGIINGDQEALTNISYPYPILRFGAKTTNQIQARKLVITEFGLQFTLKIYREKFLINIANINQGQVFNCLAASAAAHLLGIPAFQIALALNAQIKLPGGGRMEFKKMLPVFGGGDLVDDCYNASPESVKTAFLALENLPVTGQKILVFGDMNELGQEAPFWHRQIGRFLHKISSLTYLILVGEAIKYTKQTVPIALECDVVANWQMAFDLLRSRLRRGDLVLVKGSTGGYKTGLIYLVQNLTVATHDITELNPALIRPAVVIKEPNLL